MDIAPNLPQLLLAWSIILVAVISPGPAVALILGVGASQGRGPALALVVGIGASSLLWATLTALGLAALFAKFAGIIWVVRVIGAAFMVYLAIKAFRTALNPPELSAQTMEAKSLSRFAMTGFLMQIANPKAIFFWLAVAAVGGVGNAPAWVVAVFVLGCLILSVLGHGLYALLLSSQPVRAAYGKARRWIEASLGGLFAYFAYRLVTDRG